MNLNNLIDASFDVGAPDASGKSAEVIQPVELSQLNTALHTTFLEDEDKFRKVLKKFPGNNRSTLNDRDPLAIFADAMVAATTVETLLTDQS